MRKATTITSGGNTRTFSYAASGQVSQDVRDASHTYTFAVGENGRNASAALNGTTAGSYLYNAFEQRVQKTVGSAVTQFVFDRFGHLLAEANVSTGNRVRVELSPTFDELGRVTGWSDI